jgi:hypothetical protein
VAPPPAGSAVSGRKKDHLPPPPGIFPPESAPEQKRASSFMGIVAYPAGHALPFVQVAVVKVPATLPEAGALSDFPGRQNTVVALPAAAVECSVEGLITAAGVASPQQVGVLRCVREVAGRAGSAPGMAAGAWNEAGSYLPVAVPAGFGEV